MRKVIVRFLFLLVAFLVIPYFNGVFAAALKLDPATVNSTSGQTFDVKVNVDAGSESIMSVDAFILYDSTLLDVQSVSDGTFFPTVSKDTAAAGKVYVAGILDQAGTSKTGTGTIATITFKSKKDGTGNLTFDCTQGSSTDSNIVKNDVNGTDIITCASNVKSTVTIGAGGPTSSPTATPTGSTPSTPNELPRSGIFDNILKYSIPGAALMIIGIGVRLLL